MPSSPYAKAIVSGLAALLSTLAISLDGGLTLGEVLSAVAATLVSSGLVYQVPNKSPYVPDEPQGFQDLPEPVSVNTNPSAPYTTIMPTVTPLPESSGLLQELDDDLAAVEERVRVLEEAEAKRRERNARRRPKADPAG